MSGDLTIEARVQTPEITPFAVKIGLRTVHLEKIRIGDRAFRKLIGQTPRMFWYTDNFEGILDSDTRRDPRGFDVRQLPEACWAGLGEKDHILEGLDDLREDQQIEDPAALLSFDVSKHALVIARALALGVEPHVWCSAKPEERERLATIPVDAFGRVQLPPAAQPVRQVQAPAQPAPPAKPAAAPAPTAASQKGTIFFGDPADVKARDVLVFDFQRDGVLVRAWPKTDREVQKFYPLTPRCGAAFRLALRHLFRYDRPMPAGVREDVVDVPAPPSVPDPRAMRACNRLVASAGSHGLIVLALLYRASTISDRFALDHGRGWSLIPDVGIVPASMHGWMIREGVAYLRSFGPAGVAA